MCRDIVVYDRAVRSVERGGVEGVKTRRREHPESITRGAAPVITVIACSPGAGDK